MKLGTQSNVNSFKVMIREIEEHMRMGRWPDALHLAQQYLQVQPCNARMYGYVGLCHVRMNNLQEAIPPLQKAIVLDERFWEAGTLLAQTLDRLQKYEEALQIVEQFLHVRPSDQTLIHLREGLQRNVPDKITDSWQKSTQLDWHQVELTHRD